MNLHKVRHILFILVTIAFLFSSCGYLFLVGFEKFMALFLEIKISLGIGNIEHLKDAASSWKGKATRHFNSINPFTLMFILLTYIALFLYVLADTFLIKNNDTVKVVISKGEEDGTRD